MWVSSPSEEEIYTYSIKEMLCNFWRDNRLIPNVEQPSLTLEQSRFSKSEFVEMRVDTTTNIAFYDKWNLSQKAPIRQSMMIFWQSVTKLCTSRKVRHWMSVCPFMKKIDLSMMTWAWEGLWRKLTFVIALWHHVRSIFIIECDDVAATSYGLPRRIQRGRPFLMNYFHHRMC